MPIQARPAPLRFLALILLLWGVLPSCTLGVHRQIGYYAHASSGTDSHGGHDQVFFEMGGVLGRERGLNVLQIPDRWHRQELRKGDDGVLEVAQALPLSWHPQPRAIEGLVPRDDVRTRYIQWKSGPALAVEISPSSDQPGQPFRPLDDDARRACERALDRSADAYVLVPHGRTLKGGFTLFGARRPEPPPGEPDGPLQWVRLASVDLRRGQALPVRAFADGAALGAYVIEWGLVVGYVLPLSPLMLLSSEELDWRDVIPVLPW